MPLIETSFSLTTPDIKWALVTVASPDGSLDREYIITPAEAEAVQKSVKGWPPGCTQAEWESGRVTVTTRPLQPGRARVLPDGTLVVNHGISTALGKIRSDVLRIPRADFEVRDGVIWMEAGLATAIDKRPWLSP